MEQQRRRRAEFAGSGEAGVADVHKELRAEARRDQVPRLRHRRRRRRCRDRGRRASSCRTPDVEVIAAETPFYGEQGGQIGDTGTIRRRAASSTSTTRKKPGGDSSCTSARSSAATRTSATGASHRRRRAPRRHPRQPLGDAPPAPGAQRGARRARRAEGLAGRARSPALRLLALRADDADEQRRVEDLANDEIRKNADAKSSRCWRSTRPSSRARSRSSARSTATPCAWCAWCDSIEFCGGTHVRRTGDIGLFKIVAEIGVAQGVRRIEAVTGAGALDYVRKLEDELDSAAGAFRRAPISRSPQRVDEMLGDRKADEREIDELKRKMAMGGGGRDLSREARDVDGVRARRRAPRSPIRRRCAKSPISCATSSARAWSCSRRRRREGGAPSGHDGPHSRPAGRKLLGASPKIVGGRGVGKPEPGAGPRSEMRASSTRRSKRRTDRSSFATTIVVEGRQQKIVDSEVAVDGDQAAGTQTSRRSILKYVVNIGVVQIFIFTKQLKAVGTLRQTQPCCSHATTTSIIRGEGQVERNEEERRGGPDEGAWDGRVSLRLDARPQAVIDRVLRWAC